MTKFNVMLNSFSSGKLSKRVAGRTDIEEYAQGCSVLENFLVDRVGGAFRRPGTQFVLSHGATANYRYIPFIFNKTTAYIVAMDATQASAANRIKVFNSSGTEMTVTKSEDIVQNLNDYQWSYAQSADLMFLAHSSATQIPLVLRRDTATTFTLDNYFDITTEPSNVNEILRYPFLDANTNANIAFDPAATTGGTTDAEDSGGVAISYWTTAHVGSVYRINHAGVEGVVKVTAYISAAQATTSTVFGGVDVVMGAATASANWKEAAWSNVRGWPKTVTIYENRLIWGGTTHKPDTVWASMAFNFFHMMEQPLAQDSASTASDVSTLNYFRNGGINVASDSFNFTIASREVNAIQWLATGAQLQIGTAGAEYIASGGNTSFARSTVIVQGQTTHGSSPVRPVRFNQSTIFVTRDGKAVREFLFSEEAGSYVTRNLALLSDDILEHNIDTTDGELVVAGLEFIQIEYQESRGILWCLTSQYELVGMTLDKDSKVVAWHTHTIGYVNNDGVKQLPNIRGLASIPNSLGTYDELWFNVSRGGTNYMEKMGATFAHGILDNTSTSSDDVPWFADSAVRCRFSGASTGYGPWFTAATWRTDITFTFVGGDVTTGVSAAIAEVAHGLNTGDRLRFTTGTDLPTPLLQSGANIGLYYAIRLSANSFAVATTLANALAGTRIQLSTTGDGAAKTLYKMNPLIWSGFSNWANYTVSILANGFVHADVVVSGAGEITLTKEVQRIIVGSPYISEVETMPIEAGGNFGSAQGSVKRINRAVIRFFKTYGAKYGPDATHLKSIDFRAGSAGMNDPLVLFTGDKVEAFDSGSDRLVKVHIRQTQPLPCNILGIILRGSTND